jgi:hypothetical protein
MPTIDDEAVGALATALLPFRHCRLVDKIADEAKVADDKATNSLVDARMPRPSTMAVDALVTALKQPSQMTSASHGIVLVFDSGLTQSCNSWLRLIFDSTRWGIR